LGGNHSLALTADGGVWSWGYGDVTQHQLVPTKMEAFASQRVVAVLAGAAHSLVITADGAVWSWGGGGDGKLGHGDEQTQLLPKKVEGFAGERVAAVSAGEYHSIAIAWGGGDDGCLGH